MNLLPTILYYACWLHFPITAYLMIRLSAGHDLMLEATYPTQTASDEYAEQSDWRR